MKIQVGSIEYYVEIYGEGQPFLLLHGFTGSTTTWFPFVEKWKEQYQLILIDIIGHGKTDSPKEIQLYKMEEVVLQIKSIVDYLQIENFHLLGYSMGGRLALAYALQYPNTVKKLVLESASPGLKTEKERYNRRIQDEGLGEFIQEKGIEVFVDKWENIPLFKSQLLLDRNQKRKLRNQRLKNSKEGLANSLVGMGTGSQSSYWDRLQEMPMDVLCITGELDTKFCFIAKEMIKDKHSWNWIAVPNAGHAIHVEKPEIFDTIVSGFLSKDKRN